MLVDRPGHKIVWLSLRHPSWLELACMVCETPSQVSRKWAHTVSQARPPRPTSPARHGHATPGAPGAGKACGASLPFQALAVGGREGLAGEI